MAALKLWSIKSRLDKNMSWLDNFIKNGQILSLNKKAIDEFINEILIYDKNTIRVSFKCEN